MPSAEIDDTQLQIASLIYYSQSAMNQFNFHRINCPKRKTAEKLKNTTVQTRFQVIERAQQSVLVD